MDNSPEIRHHIELSAVALESGHCAESPDPGDHLAALEKYCIRWGHLLEYAKQASTHPWPPGEPVSWSLHHRSGTRGKHM